jgi:hypothetical protein
MRSLTEGDMDDPVLTDLSDDIGTDLTPQLATGAQLRAGRALLAATQRSVAKRLGVHPYTVWRAETDRSGTQRTKLQLMGMLKRNNVVFGRDGSVRLKKPIEDYR